MATDVIIACDFEDAATTLKFLDLFENEKPYVKIGMELFYAEGPSVVRAVKDRGHPVFLDLKLHDIPNTVYKAMRNLSKLNIDMTNVHAAGGRAMMQAAREGLGEANGKRPQLLAVTLLTSISQRAMQQELLIPGNLQEVVASYASNACAAELDGVVCSPLESSLVKEACRDGFVTVTPGIRYPQGDDGDQQRVTTPQAAAEIGSDYIVVGRPITQAKDPVAAYNNVVKDFLGSNQ